MKALECKRCQDIYCLKCKNEIVESNQGLFIRMRDRQSLKCPEYHKVSDFCTTLNRNLKKMVFDKLEFSTKMCCGTTQISGHFDFHKVALSLHNHSFKKVFSDPDQDGRWKVELKDGSEVDLDLRKWAIDNISKNCEVNCDKHDPYSWHWILPAQI